MPITAVSIGNSKPASLKNYLCSPRVRVVINALHAKSGGGVTYLKNILPQLADDDRLELHIFLHKSQLALFHPMDERIIAHVFDFPSGLARLMIWEQAILPVMTRIMSADVVFSPANFGAILIRHQVTLLRNALAVAKTEPRLIKRAYWIALGVITFLSLLRVKRAIAVSQYAADSLSLGFGKYLRRKIRIIHHGISNIFKPDPDVKRQNFILAVSDIYVQKNLHTLFQAMKPVFQRHPDLKLLIAGEKIDQWYFDLVKAQAAESGISDNIQFLGRQNSDQLLTLYQQCRLFVFPSTAETFGNPLVEAMACGAPIASSNTAAMPEIVGNAAKLFNPMDADDISRVVLEVLESETLCQDLSLKGLERAKDFSWQRTSRDTAEVLIDASQRHHS